MAEQANRGGERERESERDVRLGWVGAKVHLLNLQDVVGWVAAKVQRVVARHLVLLLDDDLVAAHP